MTVISNPNDLGNALCVARKQLRLTQSQLALVAGIGVRVSLETRGKQDRPQDRPQN